jgi:hypothetical protein
VRVSFPQKWGQTGSSGQCTCRQVQWSPTRLFCTVQVGVTAVHGTPPHIHPLSTTHEISTWKRNPTHWVSLRPLIRLNKQDKMVADHQPPRYVWLDVDAGTLVFLSSYRAASTGAPHRH